MRDNHYIYWVTLPELARVHAALQAEDYLDDSAL